MNLERGDLATVYHAGTDSYYDAIIVRVVSRTEMDELDNFLFGSIDDDPPNNQNENFQLVRKL
jgi:hypothetical protein